MNDDDCCVSVTRREGRVAAGLAPWTLIGNGSTVAANDLRRRAGHHPSSLEQHSPRRIRSLFCSQNKQTGSSSPLYTSRHVLIPAARPFRRRWPHPSCSSTASSYHARFEPRPKLFDWLTGFLLIYSTFFRRRTPPNGPCPRHSSQKIVISLYLFIWHPHYYDTRASWPCHRLFYESKVFEITNCQAVRTFKQIKMRLIHPHIRRGQKWWWKSTKKEEEEEEERNDKRVETESSASWWMMSIGLGQPAEGGQLDETTCLLSPFCSLFGNTSYAVEYTTTES